MIELRNHFKTMFAELHRGFDEALEPLTVAQWHWRPPLVDSQTGQSGSRGNHIAFVAWHYIRSEDTIVQLVCQRRKPVWNVEGWDQKFGLDPRAQGTRMPDEQAIALKLTDPGEFLVYQRHVWKATDAFIDALDLETLQRVVKGLPIGDVPIEKALGISCIGHGYTHLGEIWHIRSLQGLGGSPF